MAISMHASGLAHPETLVLAGQQDNATFLTDSSAGYDTERLQKRSILLSPSATA